VTDVERRYTSVPVEARANAEKRKIAGYAAMFNKESSNLGGFVEWIDPAAFNKSRGDGWPGVMARYNHDDNQLLGTTEGRTLSLAIDGTGLWYEVDPPKSRSDILELVERGDVRKSSFAFRTMEDDWDTSEQNFPRRRLLSVQLVDVAPVNTPAYPDTSSALRSLAEHTNADIEDIRELSEQNELRKLFVRTDGPAIPKKPAKKMLGAAAAVELLARRQAPGI
jgi:HK97 family phage prohead protease